MDEIIAVTHVPIFEPKMIYNAALPPLPMINPAPAIEMTMVVTALED
jgi:hypothetical protein